jgi:endothelin-converting enzyme/putative endopeptidase
MFLDDADSKEKREKYVLHVAKMLGFLGENQQNACRKILALEIAMSKPRFDRVERRDRRKSYNPMTVADLQKLTPSVDWKNY